MQYLIVDNIYSAHLQIKLIVTVNLLLYLIHFQLSNYTEKKK